MIPVLAALAAGALGAVLRYLVARRWAAGSGVVWPVLAVNVVGSGAGGVVLGLAAVGGVSGDIRLVLLSGFCGGLTTFSTWGVETIQLVELGRWRAAVLNVGSNLVLGLGAAAGAWALVTTWLR